MTPGNKAAGSPSVVEEGREGREGGRERVGEGDVG